MPVNDEQKAELLTGLAAGVDALGLSLDDDALNALLRYLELIEQWNKVYNLTAVKDPSEMVSLHLLDSLSLAQFVKGNRVIDVGTGAGLPGIPLAIVFPDKDFILLDSNGKKTRFLTQVKIELMLNNVTVVHARVEEFVGEVDVVTCRAYSNLNNIVSSCRHLLGTKGEVLAMKGAEIEELSEPGYSSEVIRLDVPGLDQARHLVRLTPKRAA